MSLVSRLAEYPDPAPDALKKRFDTYRRAADEWYQRGQEGRAQYYLANLALEEQAVRTNAGEEPSESSFSNIEHRFELATDSSHEENKLIHLRSRLIHAWIRPIVWAGVVNIDGLSTVQAKRVGERIHLPEAADATAKVAADALSELDEMDAHGKQPDPCAIQDYKYLVGFLSEVTPILLGARHNTAKQFALPSSAYDDDIKPTIYAHFDGFYYDNRKNRSSLSRFPYQVTTTNPHRHIDPLIPEVNGRLLGNLRKSSRWPNDDRPYPTLRRLITERKGKRLSKEAITTLDSIGSAVFNHITTHSQK